MKARAVDVPVPGTYRIRLVARGPWVAAEIRQTGPLWLCLINGKATGMPHSDFLHMKDLLRVANHGIPISAAEYAALLRSKHPSPDKPINLNTEPPVF